MRVTTVDDRCRPFFRHVFDDFEVFDFLEGPRGAREALGGRLGRVLGGPGGVLGSSWGVLRPSWTAKLKKRVQVGRGTKLFNDFRGLLGGLREVWARFESENGEKRGEERRENRKK